MQRREFLKRAGAVGAAAVSPLGLARPEPSALVLGASAAGLAAAIALRAAGWAVQVLEPAERAADELRAFGAEALRRSLLAQAGRAVRAGVELTRIGQADGRFHVHAARHSRPFVAGALVIALTPDALRRVRVSPAPLAAVLHAPPAGRPRHCIVASVCSDDAEAGQSLIVAGDDARWLDSLAEPERHLHLRQHAARRLGVRAQRARLLAVDSFQGRRWPADTGWIGERFAPRASAERAWLRERGIATCGLHTTAEEGPRGLLQSGRAAAAALLTAA